MANLDPKYVIAPSLQMYFVDKDTGLPLSNGKVFFYENGTDVPKDVFEINNVPPDVLYVPLTQPVRLSAVGTFQDDSGNDIIPYYYPYDADGNIELYSIEVYDENDVLQFTRDFWPNLTSTDISSSDDITNFVANGQFLVHNNVPASAANSYVAGKISADETNVGQGGWYFVRSAGSTAVDNVSFTALGQGSDPQIPSGNPPYAIRIARSGASSDARVDLALRYPDVNAFGAGFAYNLYFNGKSHSGTETVEIFVYQNFGSGSTTTRAAVSQGTQLINTSYDPNGFNTTLTFASNSGADIKTGNYVEIIIRLPHGASDTFDLEFTDFAITIGDGTLTAFPTQVPFQQMGPSTAGSLPTPAYAGSDLYLPVKMGKNGFIIDHAEVGSIYGKFATAADATTNELLMNGDTFVYANYSSIGIPYSRLGDFLIANSPAITIGTSTIPAASIPLFGTGANFVTILKNTDATKFDLSFNTTSGSNSVNDQTSGFTHTSADPLYVFTVPGVPGANSYFSFTVPTGGSKTYNVWFSVDGSSSPPATPSGANIQVSLTTGMTQAQVITAILTAVNKYQFMLVDARGYFLRGLAGIDPDVASRSIAGIKDNSVAAVGAFIGSTQGADVVAHSHTVPSGGSFITTAGGASAVAAGAALGSAGATANFPVGSPSTNNGNETRASNLAVNWFIKY